MIKGIVSFFRREGVTSSFLFIFSSLIAALLFCFGTLVLYASSLPNNFCRAFAILFMVAASSYAIGNVLGFLFGIPKTIQDQKNSSEVTYQVNTSIEQLSDWLTKMIVGAGLVELKDLIALIRNISAKVVADIGSQSSQSIVIASIICFMVLGFFVTYFSTRLYIANALASANAELQEFSDEKAR
jgi:hypothetical protein